MPLRIKKIIHIADNKINYHRFVYNFPEETHLNYAAGNFQDLIPKNGIIENDNNYLVKYPIFNSVGNAKIIEKIGPKGLLYISLRPNQVLSKIYVEPSSIDIDIYYGEDSLIYSFYNGGDSDLIALTLSVSDDSENVFSKIKANSNDIEWRKYFIKKATNFPSSITNPEKLQIREYMTVEQVADYLQVKKKTIQNWTSLGKIPVCYISGIERYKKSEIDNKLTTNN
jgi:excisionase family DNA binding protein